MKKNYFEGTAAGERIMAGRRQVLRLGVAGLAGALSTPALARLRPAGERDLAFYNLHTGEKLHTTYWAGGEWNPDGLREIDTILRDFRTGEITTVDRDLLDVLYRLSRNVGSRKPFHVISGYRSPKTNATLASQSNGVAKRSLHMRGKAIDVRLPDVPLAELRRAAVAMKAGGVGYYPKSDFIHIDTGRVRYW